MYLLFAKNVELLDAAAVFGYMGAVLASVFLIPQVYKVIKTKSIKDVSMMMTSIIIVGTIIWLMFAILNVIGDPENQTIPMIPVLISNSAQLICSSVLLFLKIIYVKKHKLEDAKEV